MNRYPLWKYVIVGFALQDTLGNFAAGIMLLTYRPFDVGDFVEVARRITETRPPRPLSLRPEINGTMVAVVAADDGELEERVRSRFDPASLLRVEAVLASANVASRAELSKLLASPKLASPLLAEATLAAFEEKGSISSADVAEVAEKVTAPGVGEGLARLVEARPELRTDPALAAKLASNSRLLELDRTLGQANSFEVARLSSEINLTTRGRGINLARVLPPRP